MKETRYLLDANVVSRLTAEQRASPFVSKYCRIPADVMHEVRGLSDWSSIAHIMLSVNAATLSCLRDVMATITPGDLSLVDLYHFKGTADPVLVAAALAADHGDGQLWPTEWHVVSDDKAVRDTATVLDVPWKSRADLVAMIRT